MKTKKEYVADYKNMNPIVETSGTGTGTYKWHKYLDGIDLRYGFDTRKAAEMARAEAAKEAYQMYEYKQTKVSCPSCGKETTQEILDNMAKCWDCEKKNPAYDYMAVVR